MIIIKCYILYFAELVIDLQGPKIFGLVRSKDFFFLSTARSHPKNVVKKVQARTDKKDKRLNLSGPKIFSKAWSKNIYIKALIVCPDPKKFFKKSLAVLKKN